MTNPDYVQCFYCSEYSKIASDYPVNFATQEKDNFTPRCFLHWRYTCSYCEKESHFNGIAWCSDCKTLTCLHCVDEKMVRKNFLIYDYYYDIPCKECGKRNPALDFAEYNGSHPYQIGDLAPKEEIVIWMPIYPEKAVTRSFPHSAWGLQRIQELGKLGKAWQVRRIGSEGEITSKEIWDSNAPEWGKIWSEGPDFYHENFILPEIINMLDPQKEERILDVACGEGHLARYLADKGVIVSGIDYAATLDYGMEKEEKEKRGIEYVKGNALNLSDYFEEESFDKVVSNMAVMDISDNRKLFQEVSKVLKENGAFVFSITHPCFAVPTTESIKVPGDSQRNEDRIRIVRDYFDHRPTVVEGSSITFFYYPRTISEYVNSLQKENLLIVEMSEPKASEEIIENFPRHAYLDMDSISYFLIVKAKKISK
ncbi:MAG: class I SAM-dependent methyltransferase [Candidatus Heimdallarchaeaceae archaeon]|jgi:SAM-dependent methyltransferase